jgi:glutathione S-transferase
VIVLRAKGVKFEVTYVDLRNKPEWFFKVSPHGKVPVLSVDDQPLFESNAIAEFLDEMEAPKLHPDDPIKRARNRAWNDFVPDFAKTMSAFYYAKDKAELDAAIAEAPKRLERLERALNEERGNNGPYFNGDKLCLVDASYAPFLQRFGYMEAVLQSGVMKAFPKVQAWSDALTKNETVTGSVVPNFRDEFVKALKNRKLWAASLFEGKAAAE